MLSPKYWPFCWGLNVLSLLAYSNTVPCFMFANDTLKWVHMTKKFSTLNQILLEAITWTNVDRVLRCQMISLGHNELTTSSSKHVGGYHLR